MIWRFLKKIDIFSPKNSFYQKFHSILGGIFTLLFIILSISCFFILISSLKNKNNPIYNYSSEAILTNLIADSIDDKFIEIQLISPVFHNDVRSQFELSSKLRKQNL